MRQWSTMSGCDLHLLLAGFTVRADTETVPCCGWQLRLALWAAGSLVLFVFVGKRGQRRGEHRIAVVVPSGWSVSWARILGSQRVNGDDCPGFFQHVQLPVLFGDE